MSQTDFPNPAPGSALRRVPRLAVAVLSLGLLALAPSADAAILDVNPDGQPGEPRFGGRSLGITVHPLNSDIVFLASELGGFFVSTDGGTNWSRIDEIPAARARDVLFDPQDPSVLVASARNDWRSPSQGGIWRSTDGGQTWAKPAGSNPGCLTQRSTWGIAIPNHPVLHRNVYVATDCGIAISPDSGATWNHVDPCVAADATFCDDRTTYFDVEARVVGGQVQLDVCGDEGYFRSTDGGATWSAPDPNSPARRVTGGSFNPCNVATAPTNANTVYLANYSGTTPAGFCTSRLMENASGGAAGSWTDMGVSNNNCRDPWVVTHPHLGGNANRFEVYFGTTQRVRRQTCDVTNSPRCATGAGNWSQADSGAHADPSDIAFDTSAPNGCPTVLSTDGGISTSNDCGASWQDGNRGLHALNVVTFAGTLQGGGAVDLYAGTQDNGFYVSTDNAATWARPVGADGYNVLADRTFPARVFHRVCFGCSNFIADRGLANRVGFNDPPGTVGVFAAATQFGPQRYVILTNDGATPPQWTAWVTTDEGANWTQLGPSPLPGWPGEIRASGPASSPTFFLRLGTNAGTRMFRLSGALDSTATLTPVNTGLSSPTGAWDVDPSDPMRLVVADGGWRQMMQSQNGGDGWIADAGLTTRVTKNGGFQFRPLGVAFDPWSDKILVGTRSAGLVVSVNDGQTWNEIPDTEPLTRFNRFFFDPGADAIYAASSGRGIWRLTLPDAEIQIPGPLDFGTHCLGELVTRTLDVCNTGTDELSVSAITSGHPSFAVDLPSGGYPVSVAGGSCFPFQATFRAFAQGLAFTQLRVSSSDLDDPEILVQASGSGTVQDVSVSGATDFGVPSAWQPAERTVEVCNTGDCDLALTAASIDCADFTLVGTPLPTTVPAGSCADVTVRFTPVLPGAKSCTLTLTTDDPDTPIIQRTLTARTPAFFSLHAGLANPHGALGAVARQGSTLNLDYLRPISPKWAWDVRLGLSSLDGRSGFPDTDLVNLSANARYTFNPASPVRVFLNGGLGLYHFDPGDFEAGANLGLGLSVPVAGPRWVFEATYNYHSAFTASPDLELDQVQAGFLVSF